ncbi:MAG: hypothetical protein J5806_08540 [Lentisphaeria bacterium]|nr:hypothetical protein [Lentisphaeria bacterium]
MKKILVCCVLAASVFMGLYADPREDAQFKKFVEKIQSERKDKSDGIVMLADPTYRILFMVMPVGAQKAQLTPQNIQAMRAQMLTSMTNCRTEDDRENLKRFKDLKIRMVFSLITADNDIVTFSLSYLDLAGSKGSAAQLRAGKIASCSNLKQIGLACKMYSMDHNERFPANLTMLVTGGFLTDPKVYISPLDTKAKPFTGKLVRSGNTSYAYVGKGLTENSCADLPLAFEKPFLVGKDGVCNVLFVDGSARAVTVRGRTCRAIAAELVAKASDASAKDKAAVIANAAAVDQGR